jgi:tetratricopeptide (TPR) repeat protein
MRFILAVVVLLAVPSLAAAQPKKLAPEAKQHLDLALKAYGADDYETAALEFDAAYKIDPEPSLLYGLAQAKRLGGHCDEALPIYKRYLDTKPTKSQVAAARSGIKLCEAAPKPAPPPDPVKPPDPPPPDPEPPDPPPPPVVADTTVTPPPPDPPPPPPSDGPPPWYTDKLGGALTIGGIAAAGVGVGFLVAYRGTMDKADAAEFLDDYDALLDKATTQRRIAYTGLAVGSAAIIGGVLVYVMRDRAPRDGVALGSDGRTLFVAGSF